MDKKEHSNMNSHGYSAHASPHFDVDELIENIRDKIQQTLKEKAREKGQKHN